MVLLYCVFSSCVIVQVWDKPMWINQGRFMDNGSCGYVRKPDFMLRPPLDAAKIAVLAVAAAAARMPTYGRMLDVHVYSAHLPQGLNFMCYKVCDVTPRITPKISLV